MADAGLEIVSVEAKDVRFPTSRELDGSDAMHPDPDYSCAYVVITTENGKKGFGLTFTLGRGTEIVVQAVHSLSHLVMGKNAFCIFRNFAQTWRDLTSESQLRWIGPEKGVVHLATAAIINGLWDLWARLEKKPLWKLLCDLEPEVLVSTIDFRYVTDLITAEECVKILEESKEIKKIREKELKDKGYPAYTSQIGWLGYSNEKVENLCREFIRKGFSAFKIKVGQRLEEDVERCRLVRRVIGPRNLLFPSKSLPSTVRFYIRPLRHKGTQYRPENIIGGMLAGGNPDVSGRHIAHVFHLVKLNFNIAEMWPDTCEQSVTGLGRRYAARGAREQTNPHPLFGDNEERHEIIEVLFKHPNSPSIGEPLAVGDYPTLHRYSSHPLPAAGRGFAPWYPTPRLLPRLSVLRALSEMDDYQQALRDVVAYAIQHGIPTPTFSAAVAYYDSYRSAVLPANLIQAQRDYFGAPRHFDLQRHQRIIAALHRRLGLRVGHFNQAAHPAQQIQLPEGVKTALIKVDRPGAGIAGTDIVGTLRLGDANRAIGRRADMDALPFGYQSHEPGKMHACGYDGHMTMENSMGKMVDANQKWEVEEAIKWMKNLKVFCPFWIEEPTSPDDILGHVAISKALNPLGIRVASGEMCANRVMFKQFLQSKALQVCQIDSARLGGVNEILSVYFMAKKLKVPVCPHAGGVGLCEMVRHLQIFDYICLTGTTVDRMIEYVDEQHDHFEDPAIVKHGKYLVPEAAGYSTKLKENTLKAFEFPYGREWRRLFASPPST